MGIIGEFREFMRMRRTLNLLPSNVLDKILKTDRDDTWYPRTEMTHFQFVLVHVKDDDPEETKKTIGAVVETILQTRATLGDMTCSLILGYLGLPDRQSDSAEARQKLVAALIREHGDHIRVAHGQCNGLVGLFGSKRRMNYGGLIPNFSGALKTLLALEFGGAVEITC